MRVSWLLLPPSLCQSADARALDLSGQHLAGVWASVCVFCPSCSSVRVISNSRVGVPGRQAVRGAFAGRLLGALLGPPPVWGVKCVGLDRRTCEM